MTGRRRFHLAVVGWLAVVAVGSTLVWTVVAQAGRDVGEPDRDALAASSAAEPADGSVGSPTASDLTSAPPTGSAQPSPSESAPGTSGSPSGSASPSAGPDTEDPSPSSTPSTPPPAETHRRTWQGAAGRVVASCTGAKISLVAAQPSNGWRVEVGDRGPQELSVKFELTEEEEDDDRIAARAVAGEVFDEVEVHARCSGGVPAFSVG
jgi:hypothetical protein